MFCLEKNNAKIGRYLNSLIEKSQYRSVRQFCIAYLKLANQNKSDEAIANMQNRMSQIIKGRKAIQTYDLPLFCELLGVSCEEILSAGKHYEPIRNHMTNYEIAFSDDPQQWDRYINREDQLFLNSDEYNKTVIDYALEFKNYKLMKYLMDNEYIWFVDGSKNNCMSRMMGFGAGTSITRHPTNTLETELTYQCEERGLRQKMIALAMENNDFETMTSLRAREIPALYQLCVNPSAMDSFKDNYSKEIIYSEELIPEIEKASAAVLDYFSEEFEITDQLGYKHIFVYPGLSALLDRMIQAQNQYTEVLLRKAIVHNTQVLNRLQPMVNESFELEKNYLDHNYVPKVPVDKVIESAMSFFRFDDEDGYLSYFFSRAKGDSPKFCANVIRVHSQSNDQPIALLIKELNASFEAVYEIEPDTSNY